MNMLKVLRLQRDVDDYFEIIVHPRGLSTDEQIFDIISKDKVRISNKFELEYKTNIIVDDIIGKELKNEVKFNSSEVQMGVREDEKP